jgi:hypothetical protein
MWRRYLGYGLGGAAVLLVLYGTSMMLPDLKRYMKIRQM